MAASCAVCLKPITSGNDFVIAGTEAVHRGCVTGIEQSIGWRTKRALAQLRTQLDQANRILVNERDALKDSHKECERLLARARRAEDQAAELQATAGRHRASDARRRQAEADRDTAIIERDAARREITLLRTLAESTTVVTPVAETAPKEDHLDASEKRFSLLELD